jgi:hypothetical protein
MRILTLIALSIVGLAGALPFPLARAASDVELAVIVHLGNPVQRLSRDQLEALFTRVQTRWQDGVPVIAINAPPGTPARRTFDYVVLDLDAEQVGRFWLDRRIRGMGMPPKQIPDAVLTRRVVENLRGSIAYVAEDAARGRVKIVARIQQGRVVTQ